MFQHKLDQKFEFLSNSTFSIYSPFWRKVLPSLFWSVPISIHPLPLKCLLVFNSIFDHLYKLNCLPLFFVSLSSLFPTLCLNMSGCLYLCLSGCLSFMKFFIPFYLHEIISKLHIFTCSDHSDVTSILRIDIVGSFLPPSREVWAKEGKHDINNVGRFGMTLSLFNKFVHFRD